MVSSSIIALDVGPLPNRDWEFLLEALRGRALPAPGGDDEIWRTLLPEMPGSEIFGSPDASRQAWQV